MPRRVRIGGYKEGTVLQYLRGKEGRQGVIQVRWDGDLVPSTYTYMLEAKCLNCGMFEDDHGDALQVEFMNKQLYAAEEKLTDWARALRPGDILVGPEGRRLHVVSVSTDELVVDVENRTVHRVTYSELGKAALKLKLQRLCRSCKRTRKEHLKKSKCLFGPTRWS